MQRKMTAVRRCTCGGPQSRHPRVPKKGRPPEGDRALLDLQIGCSWNYHGAPIVGLGRSRAHIPWFCCNQRYYRGWDGERVHVFCTKMYDLRTLIEHTDSLC